MYGNPGIILMFHVAWGSGANVLTDGFKVAYDMRERYPEEFEMLSSYGLEAGRRLGYYGAGDMHFKNDPSVIQCDEAGNIIRVQYHEIYRSPMTNLDFESFPKYWKALQLFIDMVQSPEYQVSVTMEQGSCLILNNWRMLHGRTGGVRDRTILGGTITRDQFYSRIRMQEVEETNFDATGRSEVGLPARLMKAML